MMHRLLVSLLVLASLPAHAQDCWSLTNGPELKVLMQDVLGPAAEGSVLREELRFAMQANLDQLKADPAGPYKVILCSLDRSIDSFTDDEVRGLHERDVLVQLWGALRSDALDGGAGQSPIGIMNYASIPVVRFRSELTTLPQQLTQQLKLAAAAGDRETRIMALLAGGPLLQGYVAMSGAVRAYKLEQYDAAFAGFCAAIQKVEEARRRTAKPQMQPPMDFVALRSRLRDLATDSLKRGKASDRPSPLKAMPPPRTEDPCVP